MCVPVERELWREQDRVQYHEFSADRESTVKLFVQKTLNIFVFLVFAVLLQIVFLLGYGNCVLVDRKSFFSDWTLGF